MSHRLLQGYALVVTVLAVFLAVGRWRSTDETVSPSASAALIRSELIGPAGENRDSAAGRFHDRDHPDAASDETATAEGNSAKDGVRAGTVPTISWRIERGMMPLLDHESGRTCAEKIRSRVVRLRQDLSSAGADVGKRNSLLDVAGQMLNQASGNPESRLSRALLDLFRDECEPEIAALYGRVLTLRTMSNEESADFARLIDRLAGSATPGDRINYLGLLAYTDDPAKGRNWSNLLTSDGSAEVRSAAAGTAPDNSPGSRLTLLRAAQRDPDSRVRECSIYSIGENPNSGEMQALLDILRQDPEKGPQEAVIWCCDRYTTVRDTAAREALLVVARDGLRDAGIREAAANALLWGASGDGLEQDPAVRQELEGLLESLKTPEGGAEH